MSSGNPELLAKIKEEIRCRGPITFTRFMELALYEPRLGYYTASGTSEPRVGWDGDYYTSPTVHPAFARAIACQVSQMDRLLGHPSPLTIVEMGAGTGLFARDLLAALAQSDPGLHARLQCVLVEQSPAMQVSQAATVGEATSDANRVSWVRSVEQLAPESVVGVCISNELVDAFPVHRVTSQGGELKEIYVDLDNDRLCEQVGPPSTGQLRAYLGRLGITLAEGQLAEINLNALAWMRTVARSVKRGFVITMDYGHPAAELYAPARKKGTLLCYSRHRVYDEPFERVGLQDMTAHVDFTSLALEGAQAGLEVTGFTDQLSFLTGLGIEAALDAVEPDSMEFRSIVELIRPQGMGRTFKVLIQHKGVPRPQLDGLRFKAFFGSALVAPPGEASLSMANHLE